MALPDKHQLKFNIHKDAKILMEAIEKQFGGNKETKKVQKTLLKQQYENFIGFSSESLDQIHDRLQKLISRLKILGESLSQEDINLKFLRSLPTDTNEPVSAAVSVSAVSAKIPVSTLLNRTGRNLRANGPTSMGFDMSKVECYNCHRKGPFVRECRSPKDTRRNDAAEPQRRNVLVKNSTSNALVSQCDGVGSYDWSFQADEEPTNYALMAFTSSSSSSDNESDESLPLSPICDRYQSGNGYHVVPPPYTGTFMPPKPDLVFYNAPNAIETVHTAFNVEISPTKPDKDLSPTPRPLAHIIEDWPIMTSILAASPKTAIPKPKSQGNSKNRKACFVCKSLKHIIKDCDFHEKKMAQIPARNHAQKGNHQQHTRMTLPNPQRHVVPIAVLTQSKLVPITAVRPVTTAVPKPTVTRPRQAKTIIIKPNSPPRRHINRSPTLKASNFPPKVTAAKATMDKGVIDSGCSRHITGNMSYLSNFEELNGGYVAFGRNPKGGKIFGKGKIRTGKLDFDDVYFVKELKFNLFSVSEMCDKKNSVLFTDTKCLVLSLEFKLPDENQMLLRVPRENNMYNVDLKNIVPFRDLTCLFAKATLDESNLWYRRLGHINFKTMNKLVKGNLVRGLPSKVFENNHTCVACKKGKQHRASCKTKHVSSINQPLQRLHMDLFGPTFVKSLNKKSYCLVVTDDHSRFTWMFFLATKDETSPILKTFIIDLENQLSLKNKILVTKPQNKTLYELLHGRTLSIGFMRPFGCPVTILNTLDSLGKFDGKVDEGFLVGYSVSSKAFRVFNKKAREKIVQQYVLFPIWSSGSNNPQNTDADAAFDEKEPKFKGRKLESEVNVSPISSAQSKKQDDKTKREAKGKIPAVGQLSTNNTNTFSAAGLSNAVVSPTQGKYSYVDSSQFPNDPNMPELEDITYSDDEYNVGVEADFTNLETTITVNLITTTRVHKDHLVTQIIGDLSLATQTRSMTRVAKDQGGLSQENNDDFHTYVKSAFLYGNIKEEVYVCQPPGFEDHDYPDKIYVDDIIFGSTNKDLCKAFEKLMKDKFQMSSMGELTFFLGLQVKQKKDGIFISQDKYVAEILKKFGLINRKSASTPIDTKKPLLKDPDGEDVDVHTYRLNVTAVISSFYYLV
uniref:Ribonuclease H-like domain-containing protein n=1 Tax=Tanacetum cinerariifolium TaxID=118510 RepID=A0A6L2M5S8_TANCI|nr:ribonuclease H-like domain-containing protein [Tanacetum cinerariifolium]